MFILSRIRSICISTIIYLFSFFYGPSSFFQSPLLSKAHLSKSFLSKTLLNPKIKQAQNPKGSPHPYLHERPSFRHLTKTLPSPLAWEGDKSLHPCPLISPSPLAHTSFPPKPISTNLQLLCHKAIPRVACAHAFVTLPTYHYTPMPT